MTCNRGGPSSHPRTVVLMNCLEEKATQSSTAQLRFDNLVKPILIMVTFVRGEREGDFLFSHSSIE